MNTGVLIVGAGPTGLMLANQLVRLGITPLIIDRHSGPTIQTRALGVQARTLEIYSKLGIIDRALELGKQSLGVNFWIQGKRTARMPLGDIGHDLSPFPFLLILGQDDNERLLGELLNKRGVAVQWDTELIRLHQHAKGATATLRGPDGREFEIEASWVAGCDGAKSIVREANSVSFDGAPYEHVFFLGDVIATGPMHPEELNVYLWRRGFHLFFPMRGKDHWRVAGILEPELRNRPDLKFEEVVPSIKQFAGDKLSFQSCQWFSTYRIHHRRASRFRINRCFLLGDAAHIHSPVGAQGMNTGLQDAYNLAWKLALVLSGRAESKLLDSYASEREPVATRLLRTTDRAFSLFVSDSLIAGIARTSIMAKLMSFAMRFMSFRKFAFLSVSQTGIRYRKSPLSRALAGLSEAGPTAGDRFPWAKFAFTTQDKPEDLFKKMDDTRFTLLLIGQEAGSATIAGFEDLIDALRLPDTTNNRIELRRLGIPERAFYMLRPDGHIGLCGADLDQNSVNAYFVNTLGLRSDTDHARENQESVPPVIQNL